MTRRFAPEELTFLRNRVPIDRVIEILPDLAGRNKNGQPSFVCPLCGALTTSINAAHNLAIVRHMALDLLKAETNSKRSINKKRKRCAYDPDYILEVLAA